MKRSKRIFCILVLALLVRLLIAGFTCPISGDGITYIGFARSLMEGEYAIPFFGYRCILYPLMIIFFSPVSPDIVAAGQAASVTMGVMTVLLVYLFGRRLFDERVAETAALLGAVQPYMCRYSGDVLTETTYTFFFFLAAFLGLGAVKRGRVRDFLLAGFAVAIAYFAKPEGLAFLVFLWLWILAGLKNARFGRRLLLVGVSSLFVGLLLVPQMYGYYRLTGRVTVSEKFAGSVRLGQVEDAEEMFYDPEGASSRDYTPPFFQVSYYAHAVVTFFELFVKLLESGPVIVALFAIGLLFRRGRSFSREERYIASLLVFFFVGFSFIRPSKRFLIPLLPFFLYWSAMGLNAISDAAGRRWRGAVSAAVLVLMLVVTFRQARRVDYRWRWSPEERAGLWLKENSPPGPRVISRKGWVAFYAGGERLNLPLTYDELLMSAGESGADYFVFRESRLKRKRPEMIDRISPADMEIIHTERDGEDSILIYKFRKDQVIFL